MSDTKPLQGVQVLVTRPAHQGQGLCALIAAAGGQAIHVPVLEIEAPAQPAAAQAVLARLHEFTIVIFISTNAVDWALSFTPALSWPPHLAIAAVGQRTCAQLRQHGLTPVITAPPPYNTEALLSCPALQHVHGQRILIVRGVGGRETLAQTLRQRGAQVEYAEVYRRRAPGLALDSVLSRDQRRRVDIIVVTSNESLQALVDMAKDDYHDWLLQMPLAVISTRTADLARRLGFKQHAVVATQASDEALVAAIARWHAEPRAQP